MNNIFILFPGKTVTSILADNLGLSVKTISRYSKNISRTRLHFYFQRIKANHKFYTLQFIIFPPLLYNFRKKVQRNEKIGTLNESVTDNY